MADNSGKQRRTAGEANHGKSSKLNQDCTIYGTCR